MSRIIAQSVAKNTAVMIVSQGITWVSGFLLMLFLPRYLGSEEYGKLFLAVSVTTILQIIIEFGGGYFIAKEVSRKGKHLPTMISNSIVFRIILWCILFSGMFFGASHIGYSPSVVALITVLGFSKLWEGVTKVYHSTCQGMELMVYPSMTAILEKTVMTLLCFSALMLGADVITIAAIMASCTLLNFVVLSRLMNTLIPFKWNPQWDEMRMIMKASLPYFLWTMFSVAYYRIDAVMLSVMVPANVLGWYGAAYRFFDVLMFLPSIYSLALFPSLSKLWGTKDDAVAFTMQKSLQFILLTGLPVSVLVFTFSPQIIALFFGTAEFAPSIVLLRIFSVGLLLVYIDFVLGTALFASDRQRQWTMTAFGALLLNPVLNYMFIPYTQHHLGNGGIGAALATLITEFFVMVTALCLLPVSVFAGSGSGFLVKGCLAVLPMFAALWIMNGSDVPWIISAVISSVVYAAGLLSFNAVDRTDRKFLRSFLTVTNLRSIFAVSKEQS